MPTLLPPFSIHQPASLDEASQMLVEFGDDGRAYAGGTELLLAMKQGGLRFGHLVDLKTIPGLADIEAANGAVRIGALATHHAIEHSPLVAERLPVLAELEKHVANVRVRAAGTLGGNLCFGEPHSDPATLLLCLDAHLQTSQRELSLPEFMVGSYETALAEGEILTSITVSGLKSSQRAAWKKFQVHEYPMLSLAVVVDRAEDGALSDTRLAVGSVSPTPRRVPEAEALLNGPGNEAEKHLDDAAEAVADAADLLDDHEGTAEYKRHLIHVFLRRAFEELT
jgi:aerobic carbon-monoxide dehydrogenase medium subunit